MPAWRCSFLAPKSSTQESVIEAGTASEAALSYHDENDEVGFRYRHEEADRGVVYIRFALVSVASEDGAVVELVTRMYHHGLWRKGGVKRPGTLDTLAGIAKALGYTHDPQSLVEPGWDLEESIPEAEERRRQQWMSPSESRSGFAK